MENSVKRIMVNTIVKNAIHELKSDPERTVRNLVDMALKFADSRFLQEFYSGAQALLTNENSAYYDLVKETVCHINEETLLTFSMNLGFNGLYDGSNRLRNAPGYHVPWTICLTVKDGKLSDRYNKAIDQGEEMGIHSWHLFSKSGLYSCMTLAEQHPDSAFVIFCSPGEINWNLLDYAENIHNIAFMVPYDKDADVICDMLRASGFLYGLYYSYTQEDLSSIQNGELLHDMEQLHPVFSILMSRFPCQTKLQEQVYQWVTQARLDQEFKTIPWELCSDTLWIDDIISGNPLCIGFDEYGQLHSQNGLNPGYGLNFHTNDLPEILKRAFAEQKGTVQA